MAFVNAIIRLAVEENEGETVGAKSGLARAEESFGISVARPAGPANPVIHRATEMPED